MLQRTTIVLVLLLLISNDDIVHFPSCSAQQQQQQQYYYYSNVPKYALPSTQSTKHADLISSNHYKQKRLLTIEEVQQQQSQQTNDSSSTDTASAIKITKSSSSSTTSLKTSLNDIITLEEDYFNNNIDSITSTTNSKNVKEQQQNHRRAVVHIGPHKTGSTTIQSMITKLQVELQKDGYYMPGTWPVRSNAVNMQYLADCFVTTNTSITEPDDSDTTENNTEVDEDIDNTNNSDQFFRSNETCNITLYNDLIDIGNDVSKPNVLLTAEAFAYDIIDTAKIQTILQPWENDITILAYYRRFYEWCLSYYNMETKYQSIEERIPLFYWISNISWLYTLYNDMYTVGVTKRWQQQFGKDAVQIYNMHDPMNDDRLLENFFCQLLPNATTTCNALYKRKKQNGGRSFMRMNPSVETFVYSELAHEAYVLNYLEIETNGPINWTHIIDRVQYHQEIDLQRNATDFDSQYWDCPEQDIYDTLFDLSIQAEKVLFPNFFTTTDGENKLRNGFQSYVRDNKFCSVNVTAVLQDVTNNDWGDFFIGKIFSQP